MVNVIFKYKIVLGPNEHVLPIGSRVVHFAVDPKNGNLCAWISHAPIEHGTQMGLHRYQTIATGQGYDTSVWEHCHTTVTEKGFVWHLLSEKIPGSGKRTQTDRSHSYVNQ